jgi:hypothetical protein
VTGAAVSSEGLPSSSITVPLDGLLDLRSTLLTAVGYIIHLWPREQRAHLHQRAAPGALGWLSPHGPERLYGTQVVLVDYFPCRLPESLTRSMRVREAYPPSLGLEPRAGRSGLLLCRLGSALAKL